MTNPPVGHALDCARARSLIDAFLIDELHPTEAARLSAHVKGCAACTVEIGGGTLVMALLGSLPVPRSTPELDERILLAALDDRVQRHSHHSWLSDLRTQVIRGAMRTTATLMATIVAVALLGAAFVFAASQFVTQLPVFTGQRATIAPVETPATSVPAVQSAEPATPRPSSVTSATPVPVIVSVPTDSAAPTVSPAPSPSPSPSVEPSPSATAEPTPTPTPTPSPTEKPRRTPPPSAQPTLSP